MLGASWCQPLPGDWGPCFLLGSRLVTLLINAVVGNSCSPIFSPPEDSEAFPPPNATWTWTCRCCPWGQQLWGCAGAARVPSLGSGVVSLPDLPRNSHLPFFLGVQSEVSAKQQELPFGAASGRCRQHPCGRALTFSR